MTTLEISLGNGLNQMIFGMPKNIVEQKFRTPDSIHIENYKKEDEYQRWEYLEEKVDLYFNKEEGYSLDSIEIENPEALLFHYKIIGMSLKEFESIIPELNIPDLALSENNDYYISEKYSVNFWFESGKITSIQWGCFSDKDENLIKPFK